MKVTFWGVRGSVPTPRRDVLRYGGNTTSIEVEAGGCHFVVDAGTGIIDLGRKLYAGDRRDFRLLFTHLHHDHTQGFPFFMPAFSPHFSFDVHCGDFFTKSVQEVLAAGMSDPFFPVPLKSLGSRLVFHDIPFNGGEMIGDLCDGTVDALKLKHPRDGVVGYRFKCGDKRIVFVTDCEHYPGRDDSLVPFIEGCDIFIHDTMYTEEEYKAKLGWGHSTIEHAVAISKQAGVKTLVCTHHEPVHSDDFLDEMFDKARKDFPNTIGAREGLSLEV